MSVSPAGSKGSYEIQSKKGNKLGVTTTLGQNSHHRGRNFTLNGTKGEVGVSKNIV